jgi:glycosyltransferase involved in cell wall biosynthesis
MTPSAARTDPVGGRPLRIEMVLPSLSVAGMETMTRDLGRGLAQRGHGVGVTCLQEEGALADELRAHGVAITLLPCPGISTNLRPHAPLRDHFAAIGCDVVHTHNGAWAKAAVAARAADVPASVNTLHGFAHDEPWYDDPLRWWAARHTDTVVAVSEPLRDHLVRKLRLSPSRVLVLANGIDTDRFAPGPRSGGLRRRFGIPEAAPLIGTVARLDPVKNQPLLIAAFRLVLTKRPDAQLVFVGDGPMRAELEAGASSAGIAHAVHFAGICPDVAPVYRDLDVFALPSLSEGTSISILEALASGTPVVAAAVGGNVDLLAGNCGMLVPSGDEQTLAIAILRVLDDPAFSASLASAGRSRVVSNHSLDQMVDFYEDLYCTILETKHARDAIR